MKLSSLIFATVAVLAAGGALAAEDGPPGDTPRTDLLTNDNHAAVEAQLDAARARLDAAAKEVARLSVQMGNPVMQRFMTFDGGGPHAVIGIEIAMERGQDGVRVVDVSPGGPAAEAGIRAGDVITAVNGTEAKGEESSRQVVRAIRSSTPDGKLKVRVLRCGKPQEFTVVARMPPMRGRIDPPGLFAGPGHPSVFNFEELGVPSLSNMQLATLTPGLGHYFGTEKGVLVVRAPTNSTFKLQDGDVILSIDGREPVSGAHATRILASYQGGEKVMLRVMREHKPVDLETKLPEPSALHGSSG